MRAESAKMRNERQESKIAARNACAQKTIGRRRTTRGASSIHNQPQHQSHKMHEESTTTTTTKAKETTLETMYELECVHSTNEKSETSNRMRHILHIGNKRNEATKNPAHFCVQTHVGNWQQQNHQRTYKRRCVFVILAITFIIAIIRQSVCTERWIQWVQNDTAKPKFPRIFRYH